MELGSLESPSPKPHFRPWKAIFDHKKSTFDQFWAIFQPPSVLSLSFSIVIEWFWMIQTESKFRIKNQNSPKSKLIRFSTHLLQSGSYGPEPVTPRTKWSGPRTIPGQLELSVDPWLPIFVVNDVTYSFLWPILEITTQDLW